MPLLSREPEFLGVRRPSVSSLKSHPEKPEKFKRPEDCKKLHIQTSSMEFLRGSDGLDSTSENRVKRYLLNGSWAPTTLKHYNAGVTKLMAFALDSRIPRSLLLPIDPDVLCDFVVWASPPSPDDDTPQGPAPIKSTTVRTYLSGIKAWHLFHHFEYPHKTTPRVEAILRAAERLELLKHPKEKKNPVLAEHLFQLLEVLSDGSLENQVAYTVALTAFWGMARLGELLKAPSSVNKVFVKDVVWDPKERFLKIRIREAKTAVVGEIQEIHCQHQNSLLDPVGAIKRLITATGATEDDALFSYPSGNKRITLTKARAQKIFKDVWVRNGSRLTGHSFRVGGASLRWNLGHPLEEIVGVGRWRSKAYKLYIREYDDEELSRTRQLLMELAGDRDGSEV